MTLRFYLNGSAASLMTIFSIEERFRLRALMAVQNSWEDRLFLEVDTPAVEDSLIC